MLGIVIYHTNLKINNQDCIFLRTSQFPIAIYIKGINKRINKENQ